MKCAAGSGWAVMIDAATFAVAAGCFSRLRIPDAAGGARGTMLAELGEGAREVLRHTWLWLLIGQALLYHLFYGGAQSVLGPIVVGEGMGRAAWGAALAWLMAGFVVGGLICLHWRPRRSLFAGTALLALTALFPLAMAFAADPQVVLLRQGGAQLSVNGEKIAITEQSEYAAVYTRFADLIGRGAQDADAAPLALAEAVLQQGKRRRARVPRAKSPPS